MIFSPEFQDSIPEGSKDPHERHYTRGVNMETVMERNEGDKRLKFKAVSHGHPSKYQVCSYENGWFVLP